METTEEGIPKETVVHTVPDKSPNENYNETTPPIQQPKKSKKEERSKKDDKSSEQFMKSLNSVPTVEEKFSLLSKQYIQSMDENKKLHFYIRQLDKRYTLLLKEKEHLQLEFNKTVLVKSKLENLCRELQKQNKAIKEESLLKIREEEERRKETQAKFQSTLNEITTMLQQNNEKNAKLRDDNITMTEKFRGVMQQYQMREQQVDKMAKQMEVESQLSDAKLQKAVLEHQADKEVMKIKMEEMKKTLAQSEVKILELLGIEKALKAELAIYTEKYSDFQSTLTKSSQVFSGFKEQMGQMSNKLKKQDKEILMWKKRWETSQTALLDMCSERQDSLERTAATARQLQQMQSLCRTLQADRTVLLNTLKDNNIERPSLPTPPPPPPPPPPPQPASNTKVEAMAANCVQLRKSLARLQNQLNVIKCKKEEPPKPEKPEKVKKGKNKNKNKKSTLDKDIKLETDESNEVEMAENDNTQTETVEDEDTVEVLIEAINNANINLCDLEAVVDKTEEIKLEEEDTLATQTESTQPKIEEIEALTGQIEDLKAKVEEKIKAESVSIAEAENDVIAVGNLNGEILQELKCKENANKNVLKDETTVDKDMSVIDRNSVKETSHNVEAKSILECNENTQVTL